MNILKRYWRIIFPIIIMAIIWSFSSRNGAVSDIESNNFANAVGFDNGFARKFAHFVLFGALGYSATSFIKGLHPLTFPKHTQVFYPVILAVVYGALDEVHQLTVAGRNGSAEDVLIDALAGVAGVLLYVTIFCFYRIWRNKRRAVAAVLAEQEEKMVQD